MCVYILVKICFQMVAENSSNSSCLFSATMHAEHTRIFLSDVILTSRLSRQHVRAICFVLTASHVRSHRTRSEYVFCTIVIYRKSDGMVCMVERSRCVARPFTNARAFNHDLVSRHEPCCDSIVLCRAAVCEQRCLLLWPSMFEYWLWL